MPVPDQVVGGVRLMSDYSSEWPLWIGNVNVTADHLGLSSALACRLWDWERHFDTHHNHKSGWDSEPAREWYANQAEALFRDLRTELSPDVALALDVWPLGAAKDPDSID